MIDGDFSFGDHHLRRGDYHVAFQGGTHPMAHSRGGCLLLINEYSVAA